MNYTVSEMLQFSIIRILKLTFWYECVKNNGKSSGSIRYSTTTILLVLVGTVGAIAVVVVVVVAVGAVEAVP